MEWHDDQRDRSGDEIKPDEEIWLAADVHVWLRPVNGSVRVACRIFEIGILGCRMAVQSAENAPLSDRVELEFNLHASRFRFSGIAKQIDGAEAGQIEVRFADASGRSWNELVETLCLLAAEQASRRVRQAAQRFAAAFGTRKEAAGPPPLREAAAAPTGGFVPGKAARGAPIGERRSQTRQPVDTTAEILLVNTASRLQGRIVDLSLGGCRIKTQQRFPVGIYTRVETEFSLEGLPFRLGGVVQAIHDRQDVGIRFLDVSVRKREMLEQLIAEIEASNATKKTA